MSVLSIFIDESGDYGSNSDYYLLTLVFHNQDKSIDSRVKRFEESVAQLGFVGKDLLHTGSLVRREDRFKETNLDVRRKLFTRLLGFAMNCGITYKTFCIDKREHSDVMAIANRLARELSIFFRDHMEHFTSFDHVIAYYDNGQHIVTQLINAVLGAVFFDIEFRKVIPSQYRLFQCADLFCTLELLRTKLNSGTGMTASERRFFGSPRLLKKDYLKSIDKLRFKE